MLALAALAGLLISGRKGEVLDSVAVLPLCDYGQGTTMNSLIYSAMDPEGKERALEYWRKKDSFDILDTTAAFP